MSALDNRIDRIEEKTLAHGADEEQLALLEKLKNLKAREMYDKTPTGRMIPLAADEDLYNKAMYNKSIVDALESLSEPYEAFLGKEDPTLKDRIDLLKTIVTGLGTYATSRGTLAGKAMEQERLALNDFANNLAEIDESLRDALGVGATSDPEKKRAAEARYAQKKDEQFLSVKNYMSRSGQNITADMKKDKMLTTFNADELRLFHDSLTDDEKGRFFPVTESASSSQDVLNLMLAEQQERGLVTGILEKEDTQDQVLLGGKLAEDMVLVDLLEEQRQKVGGPGEDAAIRFAQTIFAMRPDLPERYKGAEGVFHNIDQLSQKVGSLDVDLLRFFHNMGNGEKGRNALLELLMPAQFKSEDYLAINDILAKQQYVLDMLMPADGSNYTSSSWYDLDQGLREDEMWKEQVQNSGLSHSALKEFYYKEIEKDRRRLLRLDDLRGKKLRRGVRKGDTSIMDALSTAQSRMENAPNSAQLAGGSTKVETLKRDDDGSNLFPDTGIA